MDDGVHLISAKRKKLTNFKQCIICQESNKHDCLRKAQVPSIEKFIVAANIRKDDCIDRLHIDIDNLTSREILWHNSCYASYIYDGPSTGQMGSPQVNEVSKVSLKSQGNRPSIDWCLLSERFSQKGF